MSIVLESEYLTPTEAAKLLRVNVATIYAAVERGSLPAVRLAKHGRIRIPTSALVVAGTRARAGTAPAAVEAGAAARDEGAS